MMKAVDSYLAIRRAAGFELKMPEYMLRSFARFSAERGESYVRTDRVIVWASQSSSVAQRDQRLKAVARFARHVRAEDERHEVPPPDIFGFRKKRRPPYIYTETEISRLIEAASRLGPRGSFRPHTYTTLLALLSVTGLRISEALGLRFEDVTRDGLIIRRTKFQKSRLVPLHESATVGLERYLVRRKREPTSDDHVFISRRGQPLSRLTVYPTFRSLLRVVGLESGPGRHRPRIHDLRHSFAVKALEASPEGRDEIGRHMLALSTYMGHANINDTYWYLETTPHLMRDISRACEESLVKK